MNTIPAKPIIYELYEDAQLEIKELQHTLGDYMDHITKLEDHIQHLEQQLANLED
jgi:hypothetical protein